MIKIEINNQTIEAQVGERLLDVADREKINIPRFCYHKKLSVAANCRMCLVKVEGAPKLMPACTTYLAEGMKVSTLSEEVKEAQKSVMEFLLINHPLDCPVCDQGGECELQDVSLEFGYGNSRFTEEKRSFINPDIGPLISTELNRCIQCSRCVRFGQEIAGVMELGLSGRGMHTSINTFLNRSMDSEISGNVIDLCPVGALTHKPSRFVARSWEMEQREFIAMNDSLGSNAFAHIHDGEVFRVTPKENESLNETWISDIDRYAYQGNNLERYTEPMIKENGSWKKVNWQDALEFATVGLTKTYPDIEVVINKNQSAEAQFMTAKLIKQLKLSLEKDNPQTAQFGLKKNDATLSLSNLAEFQQYLLVGTNLRYFEPLTNLAIRKGVQKGAQVFTFETAISDFAYTIDDMQSEKIIQKASSPHQFLDQLKNAIEKDEIKGIKNKNSDLKTLIIVGFEAKNQPNFDALKTYLNQISSHNHWIEIIYLDDGVNAIVSEKLNIATNINLNSQSKGYLFVDIEPKEDLNYSAKAIEKLKGSDFVVSISPHQNDDVEQLSDVILPLATHFESGGSHLNFLDHFQSFNPVIEPFKNSKPAWKILTVLEEFLLMSLGKSSAHNIEYFSLSEITDAVEKLAKEKVDNHSAHQQNIKTTDIDSKEIIYLAKKGSSMREASLRRAKAIQQTSWARVEKNIRINQSTAKQLNLCEGLVEIDYQDQIFSQAHLTIDNAVADNLVLIPFNKCPLLYGLHSEGLIQLKNISMVKDNIIQDQDNDNQVSES